MGSIFCSKCGVESPEDEGFCAKCGTALVCTTATEQPAEPPAEDQPKVTPKKKAMFQVGPVIIVFSVFIVLIFGLALVSEDFNCGVKGVFGIDLAGLLDASKSAAYYCK